MQSAEMIRIVCCLETWAINYQDTWENLILNLLDFEIILLHFSQYHTHIAHIEHIKNIE